MMTIPTAPGYEPSGPTVADGFGALPCNLGCGLILRAEQWAAEGVRKRHNTIECPKRRVECPRDCGQAVVFDEMDEHLEVLCPKLPTPCFCAI